MITLLLQIFMESNISIDGAKPTLKDMPYFAVT